MTNIMFYDFETMGQDMTKCAVIDMSGIIVSTDKMESDNPYDMTTIRDLNNSKYFRKFKLSIKDQIQNYDFKVEKETVKFWSQQGEAASKAIAPRKTDISIMDFTKQFIQFLNDNDKVDYMFTRSTPDSFDAIILERMFRSTNQYPLFKEYVPFWRARDIRTWIDAKLDFPKKNGFCPIKDEDIWNVKFVAHDSGWDVLADVLRFQKIWRIERDIE